MLINAYRVRLKTIVKQDSELEERLYRLGIVPVKLRNGMMVVHITNLDLSPSKNVSHWIPLPLALKGYVKDVYISTTERGGSGSARIVCAQNGNALHPLFRPGRPSRNGDHAFFYVPWIGVTVICQEGNTRLNVYRTTLHSLPFEAQVTLSSAIILPGDALSKTFSAAIQAAKSKSNCRWCTHVHYWRQS